MAKKNKKNRGGYIQNAFDKAVNRQVIAATQSKIAERSLVPNFTAPNPSALYNPANPESPNGLFGRSGQYISDKELKFQKRFDKEISEYILKKSQENAISESYDFMSILDDMYKKIGISTMPDVSSQDDGDFPDFQKFSSIPRTNGVLGTFAVPTSKISFNALYNATNDSIFGSMDLIRSNIVSTFKQYHHPNLKIKKLINFTINSIGNERFFVRCCDFIIAGHCCGQKIWDTVKDGYHYIKDVVWAPYTDLMYQIDYEGKVIGAVQPSLIAPILGMFNDYQSNSGEPLFSERQIIPNVMPYLLVPRDQLFYLVYLGEHDPYGASIIRKAYPYYELKQATLNMLMTALSINGAPSIVLYYDKVMAKDPEQAAIIQEALSTLTVGGVSSFPSMKGKGYEVDVLHANSGGLEPFMRILEYCDKMAKAALFPSDAMLQSTSGSYSSGVVNENAFQKMYSLHTNLIKMAFHEQIEKPMIELNFPEEFERDEYGSWISESTSNAEILDTMSIFEMGVNSKLIDPSNLELVNGFMQKMGLPKYKSEKDLPFVKNPDTEIKDRLTNMRQTSRPFSHNGGQPHKKDDYAAQY